MRDFADRTHALRMKQAAPKAAPGEPVASAAKGAIMGAAYDFRDAHISGSMNLKRSAHAALEAAVDNALAALAAPQQVAQEPVAWLVTWVGGGHNYVQAHASELPAVDQGRRMAGTVTPLYTAPQPAPACHHRPPCAECASLTAQGGK